MNLYRETAAGRKLPVIVADRVFVPFDRATLQIIRRYGVTPAHARCIARLTGLGAEVRS